MFSPITVNYKVRGYVIIHKPVSSIVNLSNQLTNLSYQTFALLFLAAFVVLALFTWIVYIPIRKIAQGANEYASGNFEAKIDVHSNDEIGYLAASLNYMANELNTLEEDQRKFVSNVSHDFRSPLTSIKGYVEAMLDGTIPVEMQDKYLNIILFETERLNKLTKSLLELNKFGSHGVMLDITSFDINHTTEKNEKVFVSVKDTGIGIPKDSIKKIWDRFYKTDLSRGKDKKGTGLGLSIVKEIIQAHGENINCISTEGVGTEFIFTLPLAKEQKEHA